MTRRRSGYGISVRPLWWLAAGLAVALGPGLAWAQVTFPLTVSGKLTIQGGGTNTSNIQYTEGLVQAGSTPVTISLSPAYPKLIIRGSKAAGQSCVTGGDCWATDYCEDGVCCCNCSPGQTMINGVATTTCYVGQYPSGSCPIYGDGNASGTSYQCGNCAACNTTGSGTCAANAKSRSSGRANAVCRATAGGCDIAESCDGTSQLCPTDVVKVAGTVCSSGVCQTTTTCSGTSASCPTPTYSPSTTVCHTKSGPCDMTQNCTGTSGACPTYYYSSSTVCAASTGPCQTTAYCSGSAATCPAQSYLAAGTVCHTAASSCETGAVCSGSSAPCPDFYVPAGTACTAAACLVNPRCDGHGACVSWN